MLYLFTITTSNFVVVQIFCHILYVINCHTVCTCVSDPDSGAFWIRIRRIRIQGLKKIYKYIKCLYSAFTIAMPALFSQPHNKSIVIRDKTLFVRKAVLQSRSIFDRLGLFFAGSGSSSYKKYRQAFNPLKNIF